VPRVLVVGDVALVVSGGVERMPRSGENVLLHDGRSLVSGVGANVALNLRSLGVDPVLASGVGVDALGDAAMRELRGEGVDVSFVERQQRPTGTMLLLVEPAGERTMVGARGASERFELDEPVVLEMPIDWVHVSGYTVLDGEMSGRCARLIDSAVARGIPCSVDLEGLGGAEGVTLEGAIVFCNPRDLAALTGSDDLGQAAAGWPGTVVVKSGPDGCSLLNGGRVTRVAGLTAGPPIDTTGAGDAFDAAFIAARLRGLHLEAACRWGNAAGALKVRVRGPRVSLDVARIEGLAES
jgi:sugar/nucleoside kinase (ribokinase family)